MRAALALGVVLAVTLAAPTVGDEPAPPITPLPDDAFEPVEAPMIVDLAPSTPAPTRPAIPAPTSPLIVVEVAPRVVVAPRQGRSITAKASWYCLRGRSVCAAGHPDTSGYDAFGAAGPELRVAMGGGVSVDAPQPWRGKVVVVDGVRVKLIDWCQCLLHTRDEKAIDVYHDVFFGDKLHAGVGGEVTISW